MQHRHHHVPKRDWGTHHTMSLARSGEDMAEQRSPSHDTRSRRPERNGRPGDQEHSPNYADPPPTPRMIADATALQCRWHTKYQNVQINAMEIKGRWYPTSILRPIINPTAAPPDSAFYDVSGLLNNNTDIPNHSGGWIVKPSREEHVLGIGHLPSNLPAGWINVEDWERLYTDDTEQWNLLTTPAPVPIAPAPEQPTKNAKKTATRKTPARTRVSTKSNPVAAPAQQAEEQASEPQLPPTTSDPAAAAAAAVAAEGAQIKQQPTELYDDDQDDNQEDFLRLIEQDGANFEKSVQEDVHWGFYG
ncbi:hypothetical protein ABW20_dc0100486 [Dactylellina cionopaga]|nr:hypothetical protein ABW20_dc0100486 [Dactylellina cionopaga]